MYTQLYINLKVNNQITIGLQNTRFNKEIGKSAYLEHNQIAVRQIEKKFPLSRVIAQYKFDAEIKRSSNREYRRTPEFLKFWVGKKKAPLDITEKLQETLEAFPYGWFGLLCLRQYVSALVYFGQYRKHRFKQFGNIQAQHIHECGAAMELLCDSINLCHVTTLTLPADTKEAFACLAANSGFAINRLFQPIRDKYPDMNSWFFVWEYQKRGALHLHIAHYHPDNFEGLLIGAILIKEWHKILEDISINSGIDMFLSKKKDRCTIRSNHQHQSQPMRKSVAGYFSKYAAKSQHTKENEYVRKFSKMYPPSRFWGCSSQIKNIRTENSFHNCRDYTSQKNTMCFLFVRIHKMIKECSITLQKNYTFKKDLTENLCVAEGFRNVFYVLPDDYQKLLVKIKEELEYFQALDKIVNIVLYRLSVISTLSIFIMLHCNIRTKWLAQENIWFIALILGRIMQ